MTPVERTPQHDHMVLEVAKHLKKRFYRDIRARAPGFPEPVRIDHQASKSGYTPDVTMIAKGTQFNVLEVETPDLIHKEDTARKWSVLSAHAREQAGKFWVVVPKGFRGEALDRVRSLGVEATIWEL